MLKPNLTWHDNQPLTAADVVFTVKSIQDPNWNSPLSLGFKGVGVTLVDEKTVTFTLQEPYAPFASTLTFGILPQHLWAGVPGATATLAELNTKPIGSGPYKFDQLTKDKQGQIKRYHLVAYANYHAGKPYINDLVVTFYDTPEDLVQAYRDGDVDVVGGVPYADRAGIEHPGTSILALNLPRYDALFINANSNGYLRPAKVREALARAIKKSDLVDQVLKGNGTVVNSPLPPGSPGYTTDVTVYGYDPEKAKALLTEDGWTFKDGGWFKKADKLQVQIVTADTPENKQLADLIKGYWEAIGVQTEIVAAPVAELQQTNIRERKYQTLLFGEVIGADPDLYPFWHSTQIADPGLNLTSFSNDDLDKLLEQARQTADPAARAAKQTQIARILAKELHAIFLYSPQYLLAERQSLHGVDLASLNLPSDRFNSINFWFFKTKRVPKQ
ncbi:MAG: peptide ABC transporter substrate-binding protein [Candidatus Andersenbacteria bacterium]